MADEEHFENLFDSYEEGNPGSDLSEETAEELALAEWEAEQVGDPTATKIRRIIFHADNILRTKRQ